MRKILVIIFILILAIGMYVSGRGNYLEYKELGEKYLLIFQTNMLYKYAIIVINFLIVFCIMYLANRGIKKGLKVFFEKENKEMPKLLNKSISLGIAAISSIIVSIVLTPKVILFASNVSFEKTDLIFNLDISFYMFLEPLIKIALEYIMIIFAFLIAYTAGYYIIIFNRYFDGVDKETLKNGSLIKHIIRYIRFIAVSWAVYNLIGVFDIVFNNFLKTSGGVQLVGAGNVDITIKIIANILLSLIIVIVAFLATSNLKKEERTKFIKNILVIPAYMVCMFVIMFGYDMIFVNSNEYDKEKTYIERNMSYTKDAYGIETEEETIEYTGTITTEEINNNREILDNAVIISKDIALQKLNIDQTEKGYYTYQTAGIAKINNNELVYVSPKEIANNTRTYNSKTFEYTHGYGTILTSATSTNEDGDIQYIKNNWNITKPQIYYGLSTESAVGVNGNEYDYTDSQGIEHTTTYTGNSGLKLGFLDRMALGIKIKNPTLAFSKGISKDTTILFNRNIIKRAKLVLSEVMYDENPYIVVNNNGEMFWVLDAYTVSSNYPYSTYTTITSNGERRTINYIRNSIKVIISCYDGSMKFYITDSTDPIAMAYKKMYPNVFESLDSSIPEDIANQMVYPKFLYDIQASMLEEYHNKKSEVLYRGDDSWKKSSYTATKNNKTVTTTLDSYYTMTKGEKIGLVQIYSISGKQNLTAYMVGTVENGRNKLKISKLSSNDSILGLTQLDNKIIEDESMKKEIEALDVTGAKVTKQIMVVPVENTILYIEQIYQTKTNESNNMPLLKKIVVASGNKMAIGDTLKEALENIVSQEATSIETYTTDDIEGLIQSIIKANKNLDTSLKSEDLELIGSDIKKLHDLVNKLEEKKSIEEQNTTNNQNTISTDNITNTEIIDNTGNTEKN